jgi:ABC-type multidrug transport system ATPase subunit
MARSLAAHPYLLLLDEVLAGLNSSEIGNMVETVKKIRERGITIIMIEHVMKAVMNVSDRIIVLDYGIQIAEGTPEEVSNNEKVIEAYLGDQNWLRDFCRRINNGNFGDQRYFLRLRGSTNPVGLQPEVGKGQIDLPGRR